MLGILAINEPLISLADNIEESIFSLALEFKRIEVVIFHFLLPIIIIITQYTLEILLAAG